MLRNDYTVPTWCRHRGGIVDPLGCKACRAIRQPISPSTPVQDHSIQNIPKPVSFLSSGVSSESGLTPLNPTISQSKLQLKWKGPRRVASLESDYVFVVENLLTNDLKATHSIRLRFYKDKDLNVTEDLAQAFEHNDHQLYVVLKILDAR
jgi:hypothetical protein